jgi:hypothetical protein
MTDKQHARTAKKVMAAAVSQKGGCGKSMLVRTLVQIGRWQGHQVAVFDADSLIGTTHRALGTRDAAGKLLAEQDPLIGAGKYTLRIDSQRSQFLNSLASGAGTVVHDLPGGAMLDIAQVVKQDDSGFETLLTMVSTYGYQLTLLHLITPELSTVHSLAQYRDAFGPNVRHIAVLNRAFGVDNDDFAAWFSSRARGDLLASGGREAYLPALKPSVLNTLDRLHLPVTVDIPSPRLTIAECGNLLAFRNAFEAELNDISDWIFP